MQSTRTRKGLEHNIRESERGEGKAGGVFGALQQENKSINPRIMVGKENKHAREEKYNGITHIS